MEPDEYTLAQRARNGDGEALAALVERARLPLFTLAFSELRHYEDAQDAVASALLRICRHVGTLRQPERVVSWMRRIVRGEARRLRRARPLEAASTLCEEAGAVMDNGASLLRLDIERALRRLPADQAHAVALFYLAGLPIREIARRTGRPGGTVKSWLHHGRRRLAQEMKGYAPMTPLEKWTATIVSSDLEPGVVAQMTDALRASGYNAVNHVHDYRDLFRAAAPHEPEGAHLSAPLAASHFIVLDETVGGRSTLELFPALRAAPEGKNRVFCLLMGRTQHSPTDEMLVLSAYIAGLDMYQDFRLNLLRPYF